MFEMNPGITFDRHEENIQLAQEETGRMHREHQRREQRKNIACRIHRQASRAIKAEQRRQRARDKIRQIERSQAEHAR